jgi:hypothetical protein
MGINRNAAMPRRDATHGRCTQVGSHSLHSVRPQREDLSNRRPKATAVKQHASLWRPTQGRWIPVGSHSLRSVRPQLENLSNRGRMERSDHEAIARRGVAARRRHPLNDNINRNPSFMRFIEYCNKNILSHLTLKRYLR